MEKLRINQIDFILQFRKNPIGEKDKDGNELHYGDVVTYSGEDYVLGYRYGSNQLLPMTPSYTMGIDSYNDLVRTDICASAQIYTIICEEDDEKFEFFSGLVK